MEHGSTAAHTAKNIHESAIGKVTMRQRLVRIGWMNFKGKNIDMAISVMSIRITQKFGDRAKRTMTTIFQQPGNPLKLLSLVFILLSQKYTADAKVIMIIANQPVHPGRSPDLNKAKAGMNT